MPDIIISIDKIEYVTIERNLNIFYNCHDEIKTYELKYGYDYKIYDIIIEKLKDSGFIEFQDTLVNKKNIISIYMLNNHVYLNYTVLNKVKILETERCYINLNLKMEEILKN